jgi:hypothetical protein
VSHRESNKQSKVFNQLGLLMKRQRRALENNSPLVCVAFLIFQHRISSAVCEEQRRISEQIIAAPHNAVVMSWTRLEFCPPSLKASKALLRLDRERAPFNICKVSRAPRRCGVGATRVA